MSTSLARSIAAGATATGGLHVRDLTFRYPKTDEDTLAGVSFDVSPGEVTGVLGPNGAGKSTLLGALVDGLRGTRSGSVTVGSGAASTRRSIGFAQQDLAIYPTLTVRENITQTARLTVAARNVESAVESAIEQYGIDGLASSRTHTLSGGQRRMAHLATSFVHEPPVRFLDEPTTGLDFEARGRLIEIVRGWRQQGVTTIVTAHYPEDIEDLCTSLLLLNAGTITELGRVADVLATGSRHVVVVRTSDGADVVQEHVLPLVSPELRDLRDALDTLDPSDTVESMSLAATSLRSILMQDPTLSAFVANDESDQT